MTVLTWCPAYLFYVYDLVAAKVKSWSKLKMHRHDNLGLCSVYPINIYDFIVVKVGYKICIDITILTLCPVYLFNDLIVAKVEHGSKLEHTHDCFNFITSLSFQYLRLSCNQDNYWLHIMHRHDYCYFVPSLSYECLWFHCSQSEALTTTKAWTC